MAHVDDIGVKSLSDFAEKLAQRILRTAIEEAEEILEFFTVTSQSEDAETVTRCSSLSGLSEVDAEVWDSDLTPTPSPEPPREGIEQLYRSYPPPSPFVDSSGGAIGIEPSATIEKNKFLLTIAEEEQENTPNMIISHECADETLQAIPYIDEDDQENEGINLYSPPQKIHTLESMEEICANNAKQMECIAPPLSFQDDREGIPNGSVEEEDKNEGSKDIVSYIEDNIMAQLREIDTELDEDLNSSLTENLSSYIFSQDQKESNQRQSILETIKECLDILRSPKGEQEVQSLSTSLVDQWHDGRRSNSIEESYARVEDMRHYCLEDPYSADFDQQMEAAEDLDDSVVTISSCSIPIHTIVLNPEERRLHKRLFQELKVKILEREVTKEIAAAEIGDPQVWCPAGYSPVSNFSNNITETYDENSSEKCLKFSNTELIKKSTQEEGSTPRSPPVSCDSSRSPSILFPDPDDGGQSGTRSITPPPQFSPLPQKINSPEVSAADDRKESHETKENPLFKNEKVITLGGPDDPIPPNAKLVDQKVVIEGDKIHTDTYYAIPVRQVTTTRTTRPAEVTKYEGIGPTEQGIPVALRTAVKDEHASDWYKTMFKSLHVKDSKLKGKSTHFGGYASEPELREEAKSSPKPSAKSPPHTVESSPMLKKRPSPSPEQNLDLDLDLSPENRTVKEVYKNQPRPIALYEPGHSSLADKEASLPGMRHLHPVVSPPVTYQSGEDTSPKLTRQSQPKSPTPPDQQRKWYQQVQKGGDIPAQGLGKPAPEKTPSPVIGPAPPLPPDLTPDNALQYYRINNNRFIEDDKYFQRQIINKELQVVTTEEHKNGRLLPTEIKQNVVNNNARLSSKGSPGLRSPSRTPEPCQFSVRAKFDFIAETPRELSLKKGDVIQVLRVMDKNWYEGRLKGKTGIFPISYVQVIPENRTSSSPSSVKKDIDGVVKAKFAFQCQTPLELSFKKGDIIHLTRRVDANWYEGRLGGRTGIFPVSYVESIDVVPSSKLVSTPSPPLIKSPTPCIKDTLRQTPSPSSEEFVPYKALYPYIPQNPDELELNVGDTVLVMEKCDDGWYVGSSLATGQFGTFPGNYVQAI